MRHTMRSLTLLTAAVLLALGASGARAQTPAQDPSARLREVLPPDVAARVLATIADARARQLPADALANRALKFAARGVDPAAIERAITEQATRMVQARDALASARTQKPSGDEIEAGAEAMRKGLSGSEVSALAKSAPSGRSLAMPLYVVGSLLDRGLPSDAALSRVRQQLEARASDAQLERMSQEPAARTPGGGPGESRRPVEAGRGADAGRPGGAGAAGGPPAGVPANGGARGRPATPPGVGRGPPPRRP